MTTEVMGNQEPNIYVKAVGHLRYLCVEDMGIVEQVRIPLHIFNMEECTQKKWFMKDLVSKVKRKVYKRKMAIKMRVAKKPETFEEKADE